MIGAGLKRFHEGGFCLIDSETEGLNLAFSRPWQIAWGVCDTKGSISYTKSRYLWWPDLNISEDAARITRFSYETYKANALSPRQVYDEWRADRDKPERPIVWQNGLNFDAYVIATWERAMGLVPDYSYLLRTIDTNALLKAVAKGWQPDISSPEAFLSWQYKCQDWREKGLKSNLTDAAKARKVEHDYGTTHDADSDIRLMAKVFAKVLYEVEF
jgi:DNA polymerase III epsilon subunit-like protein